MSTDVNSSASESSSPAPVAPPSLGSLSKSDLQTWRLTGKLPESPSSDQSLAASTPAEPETQAASTDATQPPASEPGMPENTGNPRKNADTRKAELNREIQDLLAQREALKREVQDATTRRPSETRAPDPAAAPVASASTIKPDLSKPPLTEDEFFALEGASLGQYTLYMGRYAAAEQAAERDKTARVTARNDAFRQRINEGLAQTPDLLTNLPEKLLSAERVDNLPPNAPIGPLNIVAQEIYDSSAPAALIRHFKDHPEELDAIERLTSTVAVVRAVAKLEQTLAVPVTPVVQVKTQSSAPPPPTTLGRKPALPADELEHAVASGDFRRFRDEANRREQAAMAGR